MLTWPPDAAYKMPANALALSHQAYGARDVCAIQPTWLYLIPAIFNRAAEHPERYAPGSHLDTVLYKLDVIYVIYRKSSYSSPGFYLSPL